ncbi:MAG: DUF5752 family protein [Synergistales bacterium]|nr:DUF5752 family protein [Synergistales bacterium]
MEHPNPLELRNCELITVSTGVEASSLLELRDGLLHVSTGSLHYHFWGRLMKPQIGESEFNNDFAWWTDAALHDRALAEKMSVINPTDFANLEELREELVGLIEERYDENDFFSWVRAERPFYFTRATMLVFDTGIQVYQPEELPDTVAQLERGSIFYHFIDAHRRTPEREDDFSFWLGFFDDEQAQKAKQALLHLDPHLLSLTELRANVAQTLRRYLKGGEAA